METSVHSLSPPSLEELAQVLKPALEKNYSYSNVEVASCPNLRQPPYHLASAGLSGNECIADIGGQPNLFPEPRLNCKYHLPAIARDSMRMSPTRGHLLGAGAGPFHLLGINSELAPNLSWKEGFDNVLNQTHYAKYTNSAVVCGKSPSTDCALMMNLYGSEGRPGPVLKITARARVGQYKSFTECIRQGLIQRYGDSTAISIGGIFLIKKGKAHFHVMPDFPPAAQLPFENAKQLNNWLTYHDFATPIVCLSVFHTADPEKLGLRMEHTHCFSVDESGGRGGHYHYDLEPGDNVEEVEYEAYFNTAKVVYRVDRPEVTLERDLHD